MITNPSSSLGVKTAQLYKQSRGKRALSSHELLHSTTGCSCGCTAPIRTATTATEASILRPRLISKQKQ